MSYTPGPWKIENDKVRTAITSGSKHVAMVNWSNSHNESVRIVGEEHEANASLISASPDMLASLEAVDGLLTILAPSPEDLDEEDAFEAAEREVWLQVRQAIDKAKNNHSGSAPE